MAASQKSEAQILAEVMDSTRQLTRYYLSKLKGADMHKVYSIDGTPINTAYWLAAHIAWAENYLILQATGGAPVDAPLLNQFGLGSNPDTGTNLPPIQDVLSIMKAVHEASIKHIQSLRDEELDEPNLIGVNFGSGDTKRVIIHHAIRHESVHGGHLSLICKLNGIETN